MRSLIFAFILSMFACKQTTIKTDVSSSESKVVKIDSINSSFSLSGPKDTVKNGEEIKHYENGQLYMQGMQKDGKRTGIWKSWYSNGVPWSETTFDSGKKNGKTTTWFENGNKRYEGFYSNDVESGKWIYWNEKGELIKTNDFGEK